MNYQTYTENSFFTLIIELITKYKEATLHLLKEVEMGCFKITWNLLNLLYSIAAVVIAFES